MVPVGWLIVLLTTPKEKLTQALAYIPWPGLSALVISPPLGGLASGGTVYAMKILGSESGRWRLPMASRPRQRPELPDASLAFQ